MKINKYVVQLAALAVFTLIAGYLLVGLNVTAEDAVKIIKAVGMVLLAVFGVSANTPAPDEGSVP